MIETTHRIIFADSKDLSFIPSNTVGLVVTSPPYPMIEMWDDLFRSQSVEISQALDDYDGKAAFERMHQELDIVWDELHRVVVDGGIVCINIGDATRTVGKRFQLYSNHSRILSHCFKIGFDTLPVILWRKQTNAPNKFMGSGMLPAGAYVTLEHEYILIFRKSTKREFKKPEDKLNRQNSAFFWEERNNWFSDVWDFKGTRQKLKSRETRNRSAAYPFELAYRLINMYSTKGDVVLDPFLGTGTTMYAAMASCRNSIGVEVDPNFKNVIAAEAKSIIGGLNEYIYERLQRHLKFVERYREEKRDFKHENKHYLFPVVTSQELELVLNYLKSVKSSDNDSYNVIYHDDPIIEIPYLEGLDALPVSQGKEQLNLGL